MIPNFSNKRRLVFITILVCCLVPFGAFGKDYKLEWDANPEIDIKGYKVFYKADSSGQPAGDYDGEVDVGNVLTHTFTGFDENKLYFFAVKAVDLLDQWSDFSDEISSSNVPPTISNLEVNGVPGSIQIYTKTPTVSIRIVASDNVLVDKYLIQDGDNDPTGGTFLDIPGGSQKNADFTVSYDLAATPDGNHTVYAWVRDNQSENNETVAEKSKIFLDTELPVSSITNPADNAHKNDTGLSPFTGTANDVTKDTVSSGIQKVELQVTDGTKYLNSAGNAWTGDADSWITTTWNDPNWSFAVDDNLFATNTSYTVKSRATDTAANEQSSSAYGESTFTFDITLPTGTISYSATDSSHVDVGTLTITAGFSETMAASPQITIDMPNPMATVGPKSMTGSGSNWTESLTIQRHDGTATATDGASSVTVSGTDLAGNPTSLVSNFVTDTIDTDSDGTRNYEDSDDDNDGMSDTYENANTGLDPLVNDAAGDLDNDGFTNLEEATAGTPSTNKGPDQPVLKAPADAATGVSRTTDLTTQAYADNESDDHSKTRWQLATDNTFATDKLVLDVETQDYLEKMTCPDLLLEPSTQYFWRVKFFDINNGQSIWSASRSFTTEADSEDDGTKGIAGNGIPDDQEVEAGVDLDKDGNDDRNQASLKALKTIKGDAKVAVDSQDASVASVDSARSIDSTSIVDTTGGKPSDADLKYGLLQFKATLAGAAATAKVRVHLSEALPATAKWYKYNAVSGWIDFTANVVATDATRTVFDISITDGGTGDADGVKNGVVIDPIGPSVASAAGGGGGSTSTSTAEEEEEDTTEVAAAEPAPAPTTPSSPTTDTGGATATSDGGSSGCFIATAAFGSEFEPHVKVLRKFRDVFLLPSRFGRAMVGFYYRYSPPVADFISGNETLRMMVRWSLLPLVGMGYVSLHIGSVVLPMTLCLLVILVFFSMKQHHRYRKKNGIKIN